MTDVIFVGGPGRSGTSFIADRIGRHAEVSTFQDVELKIFGEFGGLLDLQHVLVESFSPNRGENALRTFRNILNLVFEGGYGQPALNKLVDPGELSVIAETFFAGIQPSGYIERLDYVTYNRAARGLLQNLSQIALKQKEGSTRFLEKTPHNCLQPLFLHQLAPKARYLHIYRNPKAIAVSLLSQKWGPATIENAVIWVRSYFATWLDAKQEFERFGMPVADFKIEEIAQNPVKISNEICEYLDVNRNETMFAGVNTAQLESWVSKIPSETHSFLDREFEDLSGHLGY